MKRSIIAILLLFPALCLAQKNRSIKFTSNTQVGILSGKSEKVPSLQTINGIAFKKVSIGIGVGYDNYGYKSIPLFLDARKKFGQHTTQLIIYADGGFNIPLRSNAFPKKWNDGNNAYQFNISLYAEAGIGISNKISELISANLTVGYSYKHFSYTEHSQLWYAMPYSYSSGNATYDYYYRRLSVRLGLQF
ncbi:MAG: hypothetical protein H7178_03885 [Chitinophagaceae bacterium]|nr:hypothetical protein [Chitinophagaceae bacterium]